MDLLSSIGVYAIGIACLIIGIICGGILGIMIGSTGETVLNNAGRSYQLLAEQITADSYDNIDEIDLTTPDGLCTGLLTGENKVETLNVEPGRGLIVIGDQHSGKTKVAIDIAKSLGATATVDSFFQARQYTHKYAIVFDGFAPTMANLELAISFINQYDCAFIFVSNTTPDEESHSKLYEYFDLLELKS